MRRLNRAALSMGVVGSLNTLDASGHCWSSHFMHERDALAFLYRKVAAIVENTWNEANEAKIRQAWASLVDGVDSETATWKQLRDLDRSLEKTLREFVLREDIPELREALINEFGLSRLTPAEIAAADPGSLPSDYAVYHPGTSPWQIVENRFSPAHKCRRIVTQTVGDLAQAYADFFRVQVWIANELAARPRPTPGIHECAVGYECMIVRDMLLGEKIIADHKAGRIVILSSDGQQELKCMPATEEEKDRARAAMSIDEFWVIIERARRGNPDCYEFARRVSASLGRLPADSIMGFAYHLESCFSSSYRWDLWAVAYIVNGGASDDGFEYFRGWLIAQGREVFDAAMKDPERAADHAVVDGRNECEEVLYLASTAFEKRTKRKLPFGFVTRAQTPFGQKWDESDLPRLYSVLVERFK